MEERKNNAVSIASWIFIVGAVIIVLMFFKAFFIPLVTAIILWYLIYELRSLIGRVKIGGRSLPLWINSALSTIIVVLILYGTIDIIIINIEKLTSNFPRYSSNITETLDQVEDYFGLEKVDEIFIDQSKSIQTQLAATAGSFANFLGKFFLILIYLIFIILEERTFKNKLGILLDRSRNGKSLHDSLIRINSLFHNYVTVKIFTSFLTGVLCFTILYLIGIELPGLWAFLIFLLNFIPTVGSLVATLFPSIFSILQFGDLSYFFVVLAAIGIVQLLVGNFIEPRMMGTRLNISPIVILVSLTFWGFIWGIIGMILAVPIMAMLIIVFSQFSNTQGIAIFLSKNGELGILKD